jgi:hypothetical protein
VKKIEIENFNDDSVKKTLNLEKCKEKIRNEIGENWYFKENFEKSAEKLLKSGVLILKTVYKY